MSSNSDFHRDEVIRRAVAAGKFPQSRAAFWKRRWDAAPLATEEAIDRLASVDPNLLAEAGDDTTTDAEMRRLFPAAYRPGAAA